MAGWRIRPNQFSGKTPPAPKPFAEPPSVTKGTFDTRPWGVPKGSEPVRWRPNIDPKTAVIDVTATVIEEPVQKFAPKVAGRFLGGKFVPIIGWVSLASDIMQAVSPFVHDWLRNGWKGSLPTQVFRQIYGGQSPGVAYYYDGGQHTVARYDSTWTVEQARYTAYFYSESSNPYVGPCTVIPTQGEEFGGHSPQITINFGRENRIKAASLTVPNPGNTGTWSRSRCLSSVHRFRRVDGQPDTGGNSLPFYEPITYPTKQVNPTQLPNPSPTVSYSPSPNPAPAPLPSPVPGPGGIPGPGTDPFINPPPVPLPSPGPWTYEDPRDDDKPLPPPPPSPPPPPGDCDPDPCLGSLGEWLQFIGDLLQWFIDQSQAEDCCEEILSKLDEVLDKLDDGDNGGSNTQITFPVLECSESGPQLSTGFLIYSQSEPADMKSYLENVAELAFIGCENRELVAAQPEWWQGRIGADRPQLVTTFRKAGTRTYHQVAIPWPANVNPSSTPFVSSFLKGNFQGQLTLLDNSKVTVHCSSQTEAERVLDAAIARINPLLMGPEPLIRFTQRSGYPVGDGEMVATAIAYFDEGQRNLKPAWRRRVNNSN